MQEEPKTGEEPAAQPQPGVVVVPGSSQPGPAPTVEQSPTAAPEPAPVSQPEPEPESEPESQGGFYNETADPVVASAPPAQAVSWTASEFIAHDKSAGWYAGLTVAAFIVAFFVYIVTKDVVSVAVVILAALVFGFYAAHQPRQLEYRLDNRGLNIGGKLYGYDQFKSFSLVQEGAVAGISLMPLKRFGTVVTAYFAPNDEEAIMAVLTAHLPYEEPRRDSIDNLMRRIKF